MTVTLPTTYYNMDSQSYPQFNPASFNSQLQAFMQQPKVEPYEHKEYPLEAENFYTSPPPSNYQPIDPSSFQPPVSSYQTPVLQSLSPFQRPTIKEESSTLSCSNPSPDSPHQFPFINPDPFPPTAPHDIPSLQHSPELKPYNPSPEGLKSIPHLLNQHPAYQPFNKPSSYQPFNLDSLKPKHPIYTHQVYHHYTTPYIKPANPSYSPYPLKSFQPPLPQDTTGKMKKKRTEFSTLDVKVLEAAFNESDFARGQRRAELAARLGVNSRSITIWFQNKRAKLRNQKTQLEMLNKAAKTGVVNTWILYCFLCDNLFNTLFKLKIYFIRFQSHQKLPKTNQAFPVIR